MVLIKSHMNHIGLGFRVWEVLKSLKKGDYKGFRDWVWGLGLWILDLNSFKGAYIGGFI